MRNLFELSKLPLKKNLAGGGFLGNIPAEFIANSRKYNPKVTISHGQSLLWGGIENKAWAFHGISELEESERCREDPWLQEVQLELRAGSGFTLANLGKKENGMFWSLRKANRIIPLLFCIIIQAVSI